MNKLALLLLPLFFLSHKEAPDSWIRINLLGYQPGGTKVAIWCSKQKTTIGKFQLVDANLQKVVFEASAGKAFGAYGPFEQSYRLNFSTFKNAGKYFLRVGETRSPEFDIDDKVYDGVATFCLKYMRQQRSGFNPFLKDSCHTHDGYTMYGPMPDSTQINVYGGWHDATDYLQYVTTSANATFHLLAAYRDFPSAFEDLYQSNGLEGSNGRSDVLDEARWGLDWLLKMHPRPDWMFNQLADDRDHVGFRLPNKDSANYGKGLARPVYFCTGEPQGLGKYKNKTTGTSSTAGKFSSAFSLGFQIFQKLEPSYADRLREKAISAYTFGLKKPGVCQTASVVAPYIYAEDNWTDDMELAAAKLYSLTRDTSYRNAGLKYARQERVTPWMGADTANHYQWYPFVNLGHFELAKQLSGKAKFEMIGYYKEGIEKVWNKAKTNAFYRGVPFIWCSNNLATSFAIQCYWYRELTGDKSYLELEQANFDWLLGCNPWGTSMIVGYPANGDYPDDPHSSFHVLNGYQTLGGLVDGPVYGKIFRKQLGVSIVHGDEYANFQSDYVVYHDDYGDYVTNEPTMDGTASLIYLLAAKESEPRQKTKKKALTIDHGAITRGDKGSKEIAIVFTGDEFADGGSFIAKTLRQKKIKASFFFTGKFYRNQALRKTIKDLIADGHYLGSHSDQHLLYCDWVKRDSLLVDHTAFTRDLMQGYRELKKFGIAENHAKYFLPPYEWYNDTIAKWTREMGLQLINYSPGTLSNADYTTPDMKNYRSGDTIFESIKKYEETHAEGLNGFILLLHIGTSPDRTDKFYKRLPELFAWLQSKRYEMVRVDQLLKD